MEWLQANYGTIIVCVILAAIVALAVISMIRKKRTGKSPCCGGDCAHCGGACQYHNNTDKS